MFVVFIVCIVSYMQCLEIAIPTKRASWTRPAAWYPPGGWLPWWCPQRIELTESLSFLLTHTFSCFFTLLSFADNSRLIWGMQICDCLQARCCHDNAFRLHLACLSLACPGQFWETELAWYPRAVMCEVFSYFLFLIMVKWLLQMQVMFISIVEVEIKVKHEQLYHLCRYKYGFTFVFLFLLWIVSTNLVSLYVMVAFLNYILWRQLLYCVTVLGITIF